jgi:hypothetical protein
LFSRIPALRSVAAIAVPSEKAPNAPLSTFPRTDPSEWVTYQEVSPRA